MCQICATAEITVPSLNLLLLSDWRPALLLLWNTRTYDPLPRNARSQVINFPFIPCILNLVSQLLINEQGLDVDFGKHCLTVGCLQVYCLRQI